MIDIKLKMFYFFCVLQPLTATLACPLRLQVKRVISQSVLFPLIISSESEPSIVLISSLDTLTNGLACNTCHVG